MLEVGTRRGGASVGLTDTERTRHVHVVGKIGSGKSKLLEHMIRQDIKARRGLCLIDPKGQLVDDIERWCASRGMGRSRNIHLIKPGDGQWTPGFNPLRLDRGETPNVRVDAAVAACAQVWGGENLDQTPRLKKVLRAVFFTLAARNLTLAEAPLLLRSTDPDGLRRLLTADLPDSIFQFIWDDLNSLTRREFNEYTESTISRIAEFLASPAVRTMVGQQSAALDFRSIMDNGDIVLVNLGGRAGFSYADARIVGTLITNDLFHTARTRDEATAKKKPFSLYIDEAHDFLSTDVGRMLDLTRSLGLHAVLAHQGLGQLRHAGDDIYRAVMRSTRTKIAFSVSEEDAGELARELMRDEINLEEAKPILTRRTVVGEEPFWLESESHTEGESSTRSFSESDSWTDASSAGTAGGESYRTEEGEEPEQYGEFSSQSESTSHSSSGGSTTSEASAQSASDTSGRHQTLRPVWGVSQTPYSLEEQLHRAQVKIMTLPDQSAIVKRDGHRSVRVRKRKVEPALSTAAMVERFRDDVCNRSPYITSLSDAAAEVRARAEHVRRDHGENETADQSEDEFWKT